jgi:hypothetical protein
VEREKQRWMEVEFDNFNYIAKYNICDKCISFVLNMAGKSVMENDEHQAFYILS